ncbi:MAG: fibronectin type III domain-containing protein [Coriobacteriia bacterium]|nr:fibronectin type III domain-containing protein [Coriobacteriia bacterium]
MKKKMILAVATLAMAAGLAAPAAAWAKDCSDMDLHEFSYQGVTDVDYMGANWQFYTCSVGTCTYAMSVPANTTCLDPIYGHSWVDESFSNDIVVQDILGYDKGLDMAVTMTCQNCKAEYGRIFTNAADCDKDGHIWGDDTTYYPASFTADGRVEDFCETCGAKKSDPIPYVKTCKMAATSYAYDGAYHGKVVVRDRTGKALAKGTDYALTYYKGSTKLAGVSSCKKVGAYSVKVTLKGDYKGTKTLKFSILPPSTAVTSAKGSRSAVTVKWGKKASQVSGYQVRLTNAKTGKYVTRTVKGYRTTSKRISGLKHGTYKAQVRTYKVVGSKTYYGKWSAAKKAVA